MIASADEPTRRHPHWAHLACAVAVGVQLVVAATGCSTSSAGARASAPRPAATAPRAAAPTRVAPRVDDPAPTWVGPPFAPQVPELAHFHAALFALETHTRKDHARIVWLGDSHGQADFWSGRVRRELQKRFGDGGPGYVALGYKNYRHEGVALEIAGKWRMRPKQPATTKPVGDGVYGLAGLLMGGYAGGPSVAVTYEGASGGRLLHDVCVKPRAAEDALAIDAAGGPGATLAPDAANVGKLVHLTTTGDASSPLRVRATAGSPDLCGAVIETDPAVTPGVVLDQLAFNGARYGTPLAWDETTWSAELARRAPDLVILEYGGNEAGDLAPSAKKIGAQVEQLVGRVRRVRPEVDCLVISPTDRADAEDRVPVVVAAVREAATRARCAYFDAYAVGGGKGSAAARRDEARPRVQKDGVHLTIRGYEEMGEAMTRALLDRYEGPERPDAPRERP